MTPKERAVMQQALRTLEVERILWAEVNRSCKGMEEAITALREALEQPVSQKPVAWIDPTEEQLMAQTGYVDMNHDDLRDFHLVVALCRQLNTAPQPDEPPAYIPYTDEELAEAIKLLDKAQSTDAKFSFIWETIYDHGNGKHLGALSRAQREVAWRYLDELRAEQPVNLAKPMVEVELTGEDIERILTEQPNGEHMNLHWFYNAARAVIAADREKNT